MQVKEVLQKTTTFFKEKGFESARLDAELLMSSALRWERMKLFLNHEKNLSEAELSACRELVRRRASGEPVAYILGYKDFYKHRFIVGPGVLIPRPETETIVERVLEHLARAGVKSPRIVDFGTGSGCIGLSLLAEKPDASLLAVDNSPEALKIAQSNASSILNNMKAPKTGSGGVVPLPSDRRTPAAEAVVDAVEEAALDAYGADAESDEGGEVLAIPANIGGAGSRPETSRAVASPAAAENKKHLYEKAINGKLPEDSLRLRARFLLKSVDALTEDDVTRNLGGLADVIVANPPYIAPDDPDVDANVRKFEPATALFSEDQGLAHIRKWAEKAGELAQTGALVMFEIGYAQGAAASKIFNETGLFTQVTIEKDLSGHERFIRCVRNEG